jgi:hypothetical protein
MDEVEPYYNAYNKKGIEVKIRVKPQLGTVYTGGTEDEDRLKALKLNNACII